MLCRAIPYEGQEPYVFLSYCHKDAAQVYPLLEQMVRDGYRVWYDDGNRPGDDWLENIAQHLNDCQICLAIISRQSADSHNCRNEINFAVEMEKKLTAIVLEEFSMPLGMRLQLGRTHFLKRTEYPSDRMLLGKLYDVEELRVCRGKPGSLPMRELEHIHTQQGRGKSKSLVEDFIHSEQKYGKKHIYQIPEKAPEQDAVEIISAPKQEIEIPLVVEKKPESKAECVKYSVTEKDSEKKVDCEKAPIVQIMADQMSLREKMSETEMIQEKKVTSEKAPVVAIRPEEKMDHEKNFEDKEELEQKASEQTADIYETEYLKGKQPTNGSPQTEGNPVPEKVTTVPTIERKVVFVDTDDEDKSANVTKLLAPILDGDEEDTEITVADGFDDEDRTVYAFGQKEMVLISLSGKRGYVLYSALTRIGRSEKRCDVVIRDNPFISNHHADIIYYEGHYYLKDAESINGTFINDEIMESGSKVLLNNPAVFRLYDEYFLLVTGESAKRIVQDGMVFFIRNKQTQEIKLMFEDTLLLDRSHKWPGGTMGDLGISRKKHAAVHRIGNNLYLEDRACANGVFLNVRRLEENEKCQVESGDDITMGSTVLEVGIVTL